MDKEYVIVTWPDVQELMDEEWFDDECLLINDEPLLSKVGSSAYFVPIDRIRKKENLNEIKINLVELTNILANEEFQDLYHKEHDIETCMENENEMFGAMYDRYYNFINKKKLL